MVSLHHVSVSFTTVNHKMWFIELYVIVTTYPIEKVLILKISHSILAEYLIYIKNSFLYGLIETFT